MIEMLKREFREQPISSIGALAGIISFFALFFNAVPNLHVESGEGNAVFQLFIAIFVSMGIAYGFGYIATRMAKSKSDAAKVVSVAFIFLAGLSANSAFTLLFTNQLNVSLIENLGTIKRTFSVLFILLLAFAYVFAVLDQGNKNTEGITNDDGEIMVVFLLFIIAVLMAAFNIPIQELLNVSIKPET